MLNYLLKFSWLPTLALAFFIAFNLKIDIVGITFLILAIQCICILNYSFSKEISLIGIYFIFTLIFLCLIPWLHYSTNHIIWRNNLISPETYVIVNISIIICNIFLLFSYAAGLKSKTKSAGSKKPLKNNNLITSALLITSGISFLVTFYLNNFSIEQLLFRGIIDTQKQIVIESSSLALLLGLTSRLIPVFCFFYVATQIEKKYFVKILFFLIMLLSAFPSGIARYMVAFVYIPFVLIFFPKFRNAAIFSSTLIVLIIFLFPFLDQFRYFSGIENLRIIPSPDFFYAAHFDAYENFASAVESGFITYGYQIIGSFLFFVPRVFWPNKPIGSGAEMADQLGYTFNNISMPFLAEGFVNFGFFGIIIFTSILAFFMAKLDKKFLNKSNNNPISYNTILYYFIIGALFFILRGDLLSSTAYVTAGIVSWMIVGKLSLHLSKYRTLT